MTDETVTTAPAAAEADRKAELIAEGAALGLKLDKRYSEDRMLDKINEAKAGGAPVVAKPAPKPAEPAPQPYSVPKGTTTMADISLPGKVAREEEERRRLMDRCTQLGIAHTIPARAGPDAIREIMGRHMAENAQRIASQEAAARVKAKGPETTYVQMRVLPLGHLKISRGVHIPGIGDEMYERGDIIDMLDIKIANEHEANGKGEILRA